MTRCRSDLNQSTIVRHLRQIGASVEVVSTQAHGFDLVVGYRGENFVCEVKQPGKKHELTDLERHRMNTWAGRYMVIDSLQDFLFQVESTGERTP
jgi:hypothetical protein